MSQTKALLATLRKSQNITKSMAYMIKQSSGGFHQVGCLYESASGSQWGHPSTCECLTGLRNKPQQNRPINSWHCNLLMELSIGDENHSLT